MENPYYKGFADGDQTFWRIKKECGVFPKSSYKQLKRNGRE